MLGKIEKIVSCEWPIKSSSRNFVQYDVTDDCLPCVLCSTRRRNFYRVKHIWKDFQLPDFSKHKELKRTTRSNDTALCDCDVCDLVITPTSKKLKNIFGNKTSCELSENKNLVVSDN